MERSRAIPRLLATVALVPALAACGGAEGSSRTAAAFTTGPGAAGSVASATASLTSPPVTTFAPTGVSAPEPTTATGPPTTARGTVVAQLTITIWERGRAAGRPLQQTLACAGGGGAATGTVKDPAAACAQLAALGPRAFAPVPADMACTMIYGGASEATIEGTVSGRAVAASYSLRDGCQIARWDRLSSVLVAHAPTSTSVTP